MSLLYWVLSTPFTPSTLLVIQHLGFWDLTQKGELHSFYYPSAFSCSLGFKSPIFNPPPSVTVERNNSPHPSVMSGVLWWNCDDCWNLLSFNLPHLLQLLTSYMHTELSKNPQRSLNLLHWVCVGGESSSTTVITLHYTTPHYTTCLTHKTLTSLPAAFLSGLLPAHESLGIWWTRSSHSLDSGRLTPKPQVHIDASDCCNFLCCQILLKPPKIIWDMTSQCLNLASYSKEVIHSFSFSRAAI